MGTETLLIKLLDRAHGSFGATFIIGQAVQARQTRGALLLSLKINTRGFVSHREACSTDESDDARGGKYDTVHSFTKGLAPLLMNRTWRTRVRGRRPEPGACETVSVPVLLRLCQTGADDSQGGGSMYDLPEVVRA